MANSITLSQSLVDDIAQKITDGTATAEQVVLYTKGLNQLQTGNDFQSVVIGLTQAAIDAIDSANAQFQEDSQTALTTFSGTATTIDTSATNAVAAVNVAKDTLIATDAGIATTISALPNQSAIAKIVDRSTKIDLKREGAVGWTGPHPLPYEFSPGNSNYANYKIDHPWKAPAFINHIRQGYTTHDGFLQLLDHELNVIDEVGVDYSSILYTTAAFANTNHGRMPYARYQYWNMVHNYGIMHETAPGTTNQNQPNMTGYLNQNGHGRHLQSDHAFAGLKPASFLTSTNITGSNEAGVMGASTCNIVGTSHADFTIARPRNQRKIYLSSTKDAHYAMYSRSKRPNRRNENDYWTTNHGAPEFSNWGKYENKRDATAKYPGDTLFHDRFDFPDFHNSGEGNCSYNMNTNKFASIENETGGTTFNQTIKLYTNDTSKKLRDVALGRVDVSAYDANPVTEGILALEIDSQLNYKLASQPTQTITNYTTADRYYGQIVLCDNDTVIAGCKYVQGASQKGNAFRRMTKNAAGTEYEFDTQYYYAGNNPLEAEYSNISTITSNDGKYVMMYGSYYYYGSGISGVLIRVSDGAMLKYHENSTSRGYNIIPIKHDQFLMSQDYASGDYSKRMFDADFLFSRHVDMTDITSFVFSTDDHQEYAYTQGLRNKEFHRTFYDKATSSYNIYTPYQYMFEYYNADGTRKSIYDESYNLI